ncbi:MAG: PAS domain S-box protein [Candidatus Eremiobacteraeota bacterium]|nr:PAS domain S-box protein [Candidatus Eremiobacteraeota bacterium]
MDRAEVVRRLQVAGIVAVGTIAFIVVLQGALLQWRFVTAPVQAERVDRSALRRSLTEAVLYRAERAAIDRSQSSGMTAAAGALQRAGHDDLDAAGQAAYDAFFATVASAIARPGDARARTSLDEAGARLFAAYDRATSMYVARGNAQRATFRTLLLAQSGVILIVLALLYFFVMRPRERTIAGAIAEIENRQQRFAAMFDNSIEMMCVYRTDGSIVRANRSALSRLGFGKDVVGLGYDVHVAPEARDDVKRQFASTLGKRPVEFATTFLTANGERVPVMASLAPIVVDGSVVGVVGSARDETAERQFEASLMHSRERFRSLFMGSQNSVLAVDMEGTIVDANDAFEHLTGYRGEEVIGKHFTVVVPVHRHDVARARFGEILDGNTRSYEATTLAKDGSEVPVFVDAAPIRVAGRVEGVFYTSRDLTAERALQRRLDEKDERIATLLQVASLPWEAPIQIDEAIFLAAETLGMAYGYVVRMEGDMMTVLHRRGPDDTLPVGTRMPMTQSIGLQMASSARALAIDDLTVEPYASEMRARGLPWKSFIGSRINVLNAPFGAVVFLHTELRDRPFDEADVDFVDVLSTMLATAVGREVRGEELREKATRDKLTGLANRAMLEDLFGRMVPRVRRSGVGLALHYVDLDGFKPINDTYGHASGDEVLCEVARRFGAVVRGDDVVARIGGDEFVVLQGTSEDAAVERLALRLRTVLDLPIDLSAGASVTVGASTGVALYPHDGSDLAAVLEAADAAMYRDKRAKAMGAHEA